MLRAPVAQKSRDPRPENGAVVPVFFRAFSARTLTPACVLFGTRRFNHMSVKLILSRIVNLPAGLILINVCRQSLSANASSCRA